MGFKVNIESLLFYHSAIVIPCALSFSVLLQHQNKQTPKLRPKNHDLRSQTKKRSLASTETERPNYLPSPTP